MFEARSLSEGDLIDADICIVGGGPAGITLALELRDTPLKVVLLESGDLHPDPETQALYQGPNLGFQYDPLDEARLRFLGGSSNHWAGNCMRLRPIDFEQLDWMPHSGWPIGYDDLDPFYDRAQPYFEIPTDRPYDIDHWSNELNLPLLDLDPDLMVNMGANESPPTAFGHVYEEALRQADNLHVFLNANVLEIETDINAASVTALSVACIDGPTLRVEARQTVLAMGGIEIPRLMLLSDRVARNGIGNEAGLVGRFFADHPAIRPPMRILMGRRAPDLDLYSTTHSVEDGTLYCAVMGSEALARREELPGFMFNLFYDRHSPGSLAATNFYRNARNGDEIPYLSSQIANLFTDFDGAVNAIHSQLADTRDPLIDRDWLGPWLSFECVPNPDSRVHLVDDIDRFGQRRIALDWQFTDQEMQTVKRATEIFAGEATRLGLGRVWTDVLREDYDWPPYVARGKHHCGTTRMSDDPATGVVDANCRVHGMDNLYIASSSVFPTNGFATPTLTIGALSVRLADHLKSSTRSGSL